MTNSIELKKAGFWIRLLATWIDCLIIYLVLTIVFYLLLYTIPFYFPFNFSLFVAGIIYSVILIAFKGQTIGKYLLGLTVYNNDNTKISFLKSLLRESIIKIISGIVLFLGFFWIGFSKKKKAWHDYLCRSRVVQKELLSRGNQLCRIIAFTSFLLFSTNYIWNITSLLLKANKITINPASLNLTFIDRSPADITDVSLVKDTSFVTWVDKNAQTPETYAIQIASTHQITLFGEEHEDADNLHFFNQLIEPLYYKSGIRVIAMEIIPQTMNNKVEKLVNDETFDSTLAMEIARSQAWKFWGLKEYWDVLTTVWKLNRSLPKDVERMRVIGIDEDWTIANFSLLGMSGDSKGKSAFVEKFRFFSAIKDFPIIAYRDNLMARNIEKEVINKNQKAVVLLGFDHTMVNYANAVVKANKVIVSNAKFGLLLNQKYKDKLFQIELFQTLDLNENDIVCKNSIDNFLDSVFKKRDYKPCGFTIKASPFEYLRDSCSFYWSQLPSVCYGDITQGLIFLKPKSSIQRCTWMTDYVTDEMFMKYKPMYDLLVKRIGRTDKFMNAKELNRSMSTIK